jgi:hypothetical protein
MPEQDIHMQELSLDTELNTAYKNMNSKWTAELNLKGKSMKHNRRHL